MKRISLMSLFALLALSAAAKVNDKFFNSATDKVWGMDLPQFDAATVIPDSLAAGNSAVVIAEYFNVDAKYEPTMRGSATTRDYTRRFMVKLLDASAVDYYSDFEFDEGSKVKTRTYEFGKDQYAFGVKVHKPDGTVNVVDMTEAFELNSGKKGEKTSGYKIAVPGLEVGDVVEYFYHDEESLEFFSLDDIVIPFTGKYPIMNLTIDCAFDKDLTVEYVTINGAPDFTQKDVEGPRNRASITLKGIPALKADRHTLRSRQLPILKIQTLNNTVKGMYRPKTMRPGGLYGNLGVDCYLVDLASALMDQNYGSDNLVYGRSMSTFKSFAKNHPEANRRQLIDAAWLSLMYNNFVLALNGKNAESPMMLSVMFKDMLEKMKLTDSSANIVAINPRSDVAIQNISHWTEPDCAVVAGDSLYVFTSFGTYLPGELPSSLQGETGASFVGKRENYNELRNVQYIETVTTTPRQNRHQSTMTVAFVDDNFDMLNVNRSVEASGMFKRIVGMPQDLTKFLSAVGEYLGVKETNVPKKFAVDEAEAKKDLDEALENEAENFLGVKPKSIDNPKIESYGNIPGESVTSFSADYKVDDVAQDMGDELIIGIGKLFGNNVKVEGDERTRQMAAFMEVPHQVQRNVTLIVPEGYEADSENISQLNRNIVTPVGNFYVKAEINPDGNIVMQCIERYNTFYVQPQLWSKYLEVSDAAANYNEAEIVLHKK